jgi:hypothetical protein
LIFLNPTDTKLPELLEVRTMVDNTNIDPEQQSEFEKWKREKEEEGERQRRVEEFLDERRLWDSLSERVRDYSWTREYLLATLDNGRQHVDIVGEPGLKDYQDYLVCVEVEKLVASRALDNVVKLWRYVRKAMNSKPVLIIQIFSPRFDWDDTGRRRKVEAIFVGERAQNDTNGKLTYRCIVNDRWTACTDTQLCRDSLLEKIKALISEYETLLRHQSIH